MRSAALTNFNSASVCAERSPCFHALRFPFGAPQLFPPCILHRRFPLTAGDRSEEHTSELQSLMRISYAVFCLTKKIYISFSFIFHYLTLTFFFSMFYSSILFFSLFFILFL